MSSCWPPSLVNTIDGQGIVTNCDRPADSISDRTSLAEFSGIENLENQLHFSLSLSIRAALLSSAGNLQIAMVVQSVREIPTYFTGIEGSATCNYTARDTHGIPQRRVCIKSILFCGLHATRFTGRVIIVCVNEPRHPLLLPPAISLFPGFY